MLLSSALLNRTKILCLVLLLGFFLRIAWITLFPNELYADSIWYYDQAINLYQSKGYIYHGVPTAIWPVGYSAFLAGLFKFLFPSLWIAKFVNAGLLTLDVVLLYQYTRLSTAHYIVPYIVVVWLTFTPSHIVASSLVAVEPLFACLLHLQLIILLLALKQQHNWLWLFNGSLIGILAYIRPESLVALFIVLLFYLLSRQVIRYKFILRKYVVLFLIVLIPVVLILPWTIRNWLALKMFVPLSTTACMNLWIGHAPGSEGSYYWSSDPAINPAILREDDTEQSWYRRSCQASIQLIRADPLRAVALWPRKIFKLWQDDRGMLRWHLSKTPYPVSLQQSEFLYTITDSYYYVILFFGCSGIVWRLWKLNEIVRIKIAVPPDILTTNLRYLVGIVTIIGFTLIYLPFFGASRFHFALTPLLAVYAADVIVAGVEYLSLKLLS